MSLTTAESRVKIWPVLSSLAIILLRKRELGALLQLCCGCLCSVSLPHHAVGWSRVCGCGISWSYTLAWVKVQNFKNPELSKFKS